MSRHEPPRLAILGAGPIGLEAALYAARLGLSFRVYDRGEVASAPGGTPGSSVRSA